MTHDATHSTQDAGVVQRHFLESAATKQQAAEMLAARTLTVREVAHRVGYRQPAQFAKAFRRYRGMAPSDFRAGARTLSGPDPGYEARAAT